MFLNYQRLSRQPTQVAVSERSRSVQQLLLSKKNTEESSPKTLKLNATSSSSMVEGSWKKTPASPLENKNVVESLLNEDANLNLQNSDGNPPLIYATKVGNKEIVECLLNNGADVNMKNAAGETARDIAIYDGEQAIIELFGKYRSTKPTTIN